MRRETKINWIIVVVLVVGSVPGALRVWEKRYTDEGRRVGKPDTAYPTTPYMQPVATPTKERVVPPLTEAWLKELAAVRLGENVAMAHRMNADLTVETVAEAPGKTLQIAWNFDVASDWLADGAARLDVPDDVHMELRNMGYVKPPKAVAVRVVEQ